MRKNCKTLLKDIKLDLKSEKAYAVWMIAITDIQIFLKSL